MTLDDADWLHRLSLEHYAPAFRDNAIDAAVLPSLNAEDLKDIGVTLVGHRHRLLDRPTQRAPEAEQGLLDGLSR